jgi:hypothetical protein
MGNCKGAHAKFESADQLASKILPPLPKSYSAFREQSPTPSIS